MAAEPDQLRSQVDPRQVAAALLRHAGRIGLRLIPGPRPAATSAPEPADAAPGAAVERGSPSASLPAPAAPSPIPQAPAAPRPIAAPRGKVPVITLNLVGAKLREPGDAPDLSLNAARLAAAERLVSGCTDCKLAPTRTRTVFGEGDPAARLVFVGEGPGADEDASGRPFVGRAGQLLDKMITAMRLRREQVFICNIVKCRPPGNRKPEPDEIAACDGHLMRQLEILRPDCMVALGATAATTLLQTQDALGRLRGKWYDWRGVRLMVTYHPSYLLRVPGDKAKAWDDLKMVMDFLKL